jgi:hypothetical protein
MGRSAASGLGLRVLSISRGGGHWQSHAPWIVAVYLSGSQRKPAGLNEAHRRLAAPRTLAEQPVAKRVA